MLFNNRKALIVGASGGIGFEIAKSLIDSNVELVVASYDDETFKNSINELSEYAEKKHVWKKYAGKKYVGKKILGLPVDLMSNSEADGIFDEALQYLERIDILINASGITKDNLFFRMSDDDWNSVLKINLEASFRMARAASKHMILNKYGRIINIASVVALMGNVGQVNYAASKAGLIGMTKGIAHELASRNITVNTVAPGFIDTKMTEKIPEKIKEKLIEKIPMQRMGTAKEVAFTVKFLASDDCSYITGETININGGMYMA